MMAMIGVALLLWLAVSYFPRPPVSVSTTTDYGSAITIRLHHPRLSTKGGGGAGVGKTKRGTTIRWDNWMDGFGNGEMIEYEEETMRLRADDLDFGPVKRGDVVDYGFGELLVNGHARKPAPALPKKAPPIRTPDQIYPSDLVFP